MCRDGAGLSVAVEIKRRGEIDGVEQLTRYLELLNRDPALTRKGAVRGIFAAQEIKPQARVLATDRGIACAVVDYDALRGLDDPVDPTVLMAGSTTSPRPPTGRPPGPRAATPRRPGAGPWPRRASSTPAAPTSGRACASATTPTSTEPLVLLVVETDLLDVPVVEEAVPGDAETYPHVYGPLDPDAVVEVVPLGTPR